MTPKVLNKAIICAVVHCGTPNPNSNVLTSAPSPNNYQGATIGVWCANGYNSTYIPAAGTNLTLTCAADGYWEFTYGAAILELEAINCTGMQVLSLFLWIGFIIMLKIAANIASL